MCCFSRPVKTVADTNIFARGSTNGRQFLVYSMLLNAAEDLAMILPLAVPQPSTEDAVRFISLKDYPDFFKDMRAGFPVPPLAKSDGHSLGVPRAATKLKVVPVGSFEASFVPAIKDFSRLDERFRLPAEVWDNLPGYAKFGFAVFKLKEGEHHVHPMAFEFPRARPEKLFFPTVHIHDGKVHARARFDHALFCQRSPGDSLDLAHWAESKQPASFFMKTNKAEKLLDADGHCHMKVMRGMFKNEDVWI
jgi:hypothetical protein